MAPHLDPNNVQLTERELDELGELIALDRAGQLPVNRRWELSRFALRAAARRYRYQVDPARLHPKDLWLLNQEASDAQEARPRRIDL